MKKNGIQNAEINAVISAIGHTQYIVIADVGLPVPKGVPCVDLALVPGIPSFMEVLRAVKAELVIDSWVLASELKTRRPDAYAEIVKEMAPVSGVDFPHERLKEISRDAYAIIRTGETAPYANIVLYAGVNF
ncbi:MAG: D-ribose pyranase [Treponema sp.]|nr:D-ribose pyranase [Treponema sp.]